MDLNTSYSKKQLQDYEVLSVLGSGSFGTCYKVRDKETNKFFAWKAIDYDELDESKFESLIAEISVLRQVGAHVNIVQYYHHFINNESKSIFLMMEFCENGDLSQLISKARITRQRFEETYIWRVLFQICKALQVCHKKLQQVTVLHRDIKPANIFLDSNWNAKLGDFGLARLVRQNERFARTFVGTPYYMSPEIIKGERYDAKSDVWALGCLTYELATLSPPFKGKRLQQLSENITSGNYTNISSNYSDDLQEIIRFMLETSDEQRPSVEIITRHPNLVRNLKSLETTIVPLVNADDGFYQTPAKHSSARSQLKYKRNSVTSAVTSNDESYYEIGNVSGVFTPDLRHEIFYSPNRKMYPRALQQSDSELYKTARRCDDPSQNAPTVQTCPDNLTQRIFDELLKERLHAIRAHEALLRQKEESLTSLELKLNEKQCRLQSLQQKLDEQQKTLNNKMRNFKQFNRRKTSSSIHNPKKRLSMATSVENKQSPFYDETYCTVEPQDSVSPTVAKINLPKLAAMKSVSSLRKVTFQSPKKIITYDIDKMPTMSVIQQQCQSSTGNINKLRSSVGSSTDGSSSDGAVQRRKSLLSYFGIKKSNKENIPQPIPARQQASICNDLPESKCETVKLASIWTKENKRAAFDLLAAMNAKENASKRVSCISIRQSMRDSTSSSIRRDRMRQSMCLVP